MGAPGQRLAHDSSKLQLVVYNCGRGKVNSARPGRGVMPCWSHDRGSRDHNRRCTALVSDRKTPEGRQSCRKVIQSLILQEGLKNAPHTAMHGSRKSGKVVEGVEDEHATDKPVDVGEEAILGGITEEDDGVADARGCLWLFMAWD